MLNGSPPAPLLCGPSVSSPVINPVSIEIQALAEDILRGRGELKSLAEFDHKSEEFKLAIIPVIRGVAKMRNDFNPRITKIAKGISQSAGKNWQNNSSIVALWFALKQAITPLSDHPTKWVASIIVDKNNKMLSWGVNQIPNGLPRIPEFYLEGIRRNLIVCAERIAGAANLGVKVQGVPHP